MTRTSTARNLAPPGTSLVARTGTPPIALLAMFLALEACTESSRQPPSADVGPNPVLPTVPSKSIFPTVSVAEAKGWPADGVPMAARGLNVVAYATHLDHPRWIYVLPNGDALVAETNAPNRPDNGGGIRGWIQGLYMKKAGAEGVSADRIVLLRDADGDGVSDTRSVFLEGLHSPFGMALVGSNLYVANTDAVVRFPYIAGATKITAPGVRLAELPAGPINHHWTKNIIANTDGTKLYATIGSNSNDAENGIDKEVGRAAIWEIDIATGAHRSFATGLRNPNGLAWEPVTGALWTVVNERDEHGNDLVPDYLTSVKDGAFYGWPYSYFGQHIDSRVKPQRPDLVEVATRPDYALGNHVAPLGLVWSDGNNLPSRFASGMFVGRHGSWNRKPLSGYDVVFVPFAKGKPSGLPVEVLTGFVSSANEAYGRPVGVALDQRGALLVADDVGDVVWRVTDSTVR